MISTINVSEIKCVSGGGKGLKRLAHFFEREVIRPVVKTALPAVVKTVLPPPVGTIAGLVTAGVIIKKGVEKIEKKS